MIYFDIHTHVRELDEDISSVVNILPDDPVPDGHFSVGVHPWFVDRSGFEKQLEFVRQKVLNKNCVAIGECGLDRPTFCKSGGVGDKTISVKRGQELQEEVFRTHIEIANFAEKPLIIHCVRAFPELLSIKKSTKAHTSWIIHGFRGSQEIADKLVDGGISLSFGKSLLSKKTSSSKVKEIFKALPATSILLESDNVDKISCDIRNIYQAAAKIRGITVERLQNIIQNNMNSIF